MGGPTCRVCTWGGGRRLWCGGGGTLPRRRPGGRWSPSGRGRGRDPSAPANRGTPHRFLAPAAVLNAARPVGPVTGQVACPTGTAEAGATSALPGTPAGSEARATLTVSEQRSDLRTANGTGGTVHAAPPFGPWYSPRTARRSPRRPSPPGRVLPSAVCRCPFVFAVLPTPGSWLLTPAVSPPSAVAASDRF